MLEHLPSIIKSIIVLGVLIFVHEFGHYLIARLVGMRVIEFSIGAGPRVLGWVRHGIQYSLRPILFIGYVRIAGLDFEEEDESPNSFRNKPLSARLAVLIAGPLMNLILVPVLFFLVGFMEAGWEASNKVSNVLEGMPAQKAGIRPGDVIVGIENLSLRVDKELLSRLYMKVPAEVRKRYPWYRPRENLRLTVLRDGKVLTFRMGENYTSLPPQKRVRKGDRLIGVVGLTDSDSDILWAMPPSLIHRHLGQPVIFLVQRANQRLRIQVTPTASDHFMVRETKKGLVKQRFGVIGVVFRKEFRKVSLTERVREGLNRGWLGCLEEIMKLGLFFRYIAELHEGVAGPIGIVRELVQQSRLGLSALLDMVATFSFGLAVFNLFPLLPLDGGRIALLFVEAVPKLCDRCSLRLPRIVVLFVEALHSEVRSRKWEIRLTIAGIVLLLALVLVISYRDILGWFR